MQERVLGAIIIGGVALVGVVWSLIAGIPPLVRAKNNEKKLEAVVTEKVQSVDSSVTKLDLKRISYSKENEATTNKFGDVTYKPWAVVSLEGYNNEGQLFKCVYKANQSYISDLQIKLATSSSTVSDALTYDVYQNYTMTTSTFLLGLIQDEGTTFGGYYVGQGSYGSLYASEGTKIVSIGNPMDANGKSNRPYSVDQVLGKEKNSENEEYVKTSLYSGNYVYGTVSSIEKDPSVTAYEAYTVWLSSDDGTTEKALKAEGVALGTSVKKVENGDQVIFTTPIIVNEDGTKVLKESEGSGKLVSCIITSTGIPTELKDEAISVTQADEEIADFAEEGDTKSYGKLSDDYYYVYGEVASVETVTDDQGKESYNIRLVTEGKSEDAYFEVTGATFDKTNVSETFTDVSTELVGKIITVKGKLTTAMNYKKI